MFDSFSRKNQTSAPLSVEAALVQGLTSNHRTLLEIYQEIHTAVTMGKYGAIERHATKLHDLLHQHLQTENLEFYTKLKRHLEQADAEQRQMVHDLQRKMYSIGVGAVEFIRQARFSKVTSENANKFRTDLEGVGSVLVTRIKQEEEVLYPLFLRVFN